MSTDQGEIPARVRAMIGATRTRRCAVTARDIRHFAQAIGDEVTGALPDDALVAPPLFPQTYGYDDVPLSELTPDGSPAELDLPLPAKRAMGGSSEFTVHRRLRPGDEVTVESRLADIYVKQGKSGPLFMIVIETRFTDQHSRPVASEVATFIKRV